MKIMANTDKLQTNSFVDTNSCSEDVKGYRGSSPGRLQM